LKALRACGQQDGSRKRAKKQFHQDEKYEPTRGDEH